MFGPKMSTVFASRWNALMWSAMILVTAYCSVPAPEDDADNSATASTTAAKPVNPDDPWASARELSSTRDDLLAKAEKAR
ncbi:MAG: hypothetical protein U5J78_05815 [Parasphingorhabdus sp.]|nr:hypothetical protein [Parasphingorhabdus sp.]